MIVLRAWIAEAGIQYASDPAGMPPSGIANFLNAGSKTSSARQRVLVVDDERLIADTVAQILNLHGYDAFTAYSADDALTLATGFRPDVLLTDVLMPNMNGIELAVEMEQQFPAIKVLLFSGQAGTSALLQEMDHVTARFHVVAKPIHPEKLVDAIRRLSR